MATITLKLSRKMRQDLSDKINRVPMECFGRISYGDILSRVTNDVNTLQQTHLPTVCRLSSRRLHSLQAV